MTSLLVLFIVLFVFLVACAYTDLARGKVYDWCTYPTIAAGLTLNFLIGGVGGNAADDPIGANYNLVNSAAGFLLGLATLGILYAAGGLGGGDVKLAAAIGALVGWRFLIWALFYSSLVGGIVALSLALWKGRLWSSLKGSLRFLLTLRAPRLAEGEKPLTVPFGLALVLGTYWCWFMFLDEPVFFPFFAGA
ncbi:MAG: prepilin peptidase [Planctomycetes bacterium]|nr:prepilin peptidase [Planctomycetota bacterium]